MQPFENLDAVFFPGPITAAENIPTNAQAGFRHHPSQPVPPALRVLWRAQMWVNILNRYSDAPADQGRLIQMNRLDASMPALWNTLPSAPESCKHGYRGNPATCVDCKADLRRARYWREREICSECGQYNVHCICEDDEPTVCIAGNPAPASGICGDPDCVCAL